MLSGKVYPLVMTSRSHLHMALVLLVGCSSPGETLGSSDLDSAAAEVDDLGHESSTADPDAAESPIELTIIETIPVDFGDMQPGEAESAHVSLEDFRSEPAYLSARAESICAFLDRSSSLLTIDVLDAPSATVPLSYQVSIGPRGGQLVRLAAVDTGVSLGDELLFTGDQVALDQAGTAAVSEVALSEEPAFDVQITAVPNEGVARLQVTLTLAIRFSSSFESCQL